MRSLGWVLICLLNALLLFCSSEVAQSCPTLCNPMDCGLPGSSVHRIFQARILEWIAVSFSRGIFLTQGSNLGLLHRRQTLYHLSHQGRLLLFQLQNFQNVMMSHLLWMAGQLKNSCKYFATPSIERSNPAFFPLNLDWSQLLKSTIQCSKTNSPKLLRQSDKQLCSFCPGLLRYSTL